VTCDRFSPGTPVSSTKKIDHYDITEILVKVALNTIILTLQFQHNSVGGIMVSVLVSSAVDRGLESRLSDLLQVTDKIYHIMCENINITKLK
jgi:hypothetical protein